MIIIEGAPELVAEIAASNAAIDLGDKKRAYRRNGIKEYIVWQVFEQKLDWFYLQEGEYVPLPVDEDGVIRSHLNCQSNLGESWMPSPSLPLSNANP